MLAGFADTTVENTGLFEVDSVNELRSMTLSVVVEDHVAVSRVAGGDTGENRQVLGGGQIWKCRRKRCVAWLCMSRDVSKYEPVSLPLLHLPSMIITLQPPLYNLKAPTPHNVNSNKITSYTTTLKYPISLLDDNFYPYFLPRA